MRDSFVEIPEEEGNFIEIENKGSLVASYMYDARKGVFFPSGKSRLYGSWCDTEDPCPVQITCEGPSIISSTFNDVRRTYSDPEVHIYKDSLTAQIDFNGKVLDFSPCFAL